MSRPESADVPTHRMIYPNRKPLLISAILVALTSVPTLVVVAAGTVSLDGRSPAGSTAVGAPSDAPVIIEPGASSGLTERPSSAGRPVQAQPVAQALPRVVASFGRTGPRPAPAPLAPVSITAPLPEGHMPAPPPARAPSPAGSTWLPSPAPAGVDGPAPRAGTPVEPRIDDRAWPGWDAHLPGG